MKKLRKWISLIALINISLSMCVVQGCASQHPPKAHCDNYGRYCDPKVKINQWTPNSY